MEINVLIGLLLSFIIGIVIGYLAGIITCQDSVPVYHDQIVSVNKKCGLTDEDLERMSIWDIVRYKHNGEYDCVWSSMHTKRDAEKHCKELNEDYHKNYGKYVVERNVNI